MPRKRPGVLIIILLRSAYLLSVAVLIVLLLEGYCRVRGIAALANFRTGDFEKNIDFVPSRLLPFEIAPNIAGFSNSLGMRDKEYSIKKKPGIKRIVVLGDSITMYGEYTDYLEEILNSAYNNTIEVWNCSIGGHGIVDYYHNLLYRCLAYKPDMVLIGICLNDFGLTPIIFRSKDGSLRCYRPLQPMKGEVDNWLYCHSYLYRFLMETVESGAWHRRELEGESLGRNYLAKIKALLEKRRIPLLVVIFPYLDETSEQTADYKAIRKVIDELRVECIDLHETFAPDKRKSFLHKAGDIVHPNTQAHRIAAETIKDYLLTRGTLSEARQ